MKYLLFAIAFCFVAQSISAQELFKDEETGLETVQQVIEFEGKSASDLYKLTEKWIIDYFSNPEEVVTADIENEVIKGTAVDRSALNFAFGIKSDLEYDFTIEFKDERARVTFTKFVVLIEPGSRVPDGRAEAEGYIYNNQGEKRNNKKASRVSTSIESSVSETIDSFTAAMKKEESDDDW